MRRPAFAFALALAALPSPGCGGNGGEDPTPRPRLRADDTPALELSADDATEWLPDAIVGRGGTLHGDAVHYFAADSATTGYLAVPRGTGPFPGVILIHEWGGLVDRIRQVADDLAEHGYVVLAADLYSGRTGTTPQENHALMEETGANPQRMIDNLDAAAAFLRARTDATGSVATIGWCYGGGIALSYAMGGENHEGTAIFYGRLVTDPVELRSIRHAVYGTFAAKDQGIPPAEVEQFVGALRQVGIPNDVHVYDDVDHGFWLWVDQEPEVRAAPALDAWERLLRYLHQNLSD